VLLTERPKARFHEPLTLQTGSVIGAGEADQNSYQLAIHQLYSTLFNVGADSDLNRPQGHVHSGSRERTGNLSATRTNVAA